MSARIASRLLLGLLLLGLPPAAGGAEEEVPGRTDRWYEVLRNGQKLGHSRVVWAPSTWEGRPTIHDTTMTVQRSTRRMLGLRDEFGVVVTADLERDEDGTLWWQRVVVEEADRVTREEITWTGAGYEHLVRLGDQEERRLIALERPVMTDAESFLGARIRAGEVEVGQRHALRLLDVRARNARDFELEVLGREEVEAEEGAVACFRVRERDAESGSESLLWIDDDGALVRLLSDTGRSWQRVSREQAEAPPVRTAEYDITTPSTPVLERVMSAERLELEVHLQGDPRRGLPDLPASPWSRVVGREGSDEEGWVLEVVLQAYDDRDAAATIPVAPEGFERELEPTVLMPCLDPRIVEVAQRVVGEETDARRAAERLSRFVFTTLQKASPEVAEASALQILEEGRGDCSEHALLFVTLCRAVGIPARRCSGYVCVGSMWGSHAWAEIWVGAWIGADPTTGEVGTVARYLFFGYPDLPQSHPGLISARVSGRLRFVATRVVEGDDDYDLRDASSWHQHDRETGRFVHVLAGIEARDVPEDWVVRMTGANRAYVRTAGLRAELRVDADQGTRLEDLGGATGSFAGQPALQVRMPGGLGYLVHSRRRIVQLVVRGEDLEERVPVLERILAPTFAPRPAAPEAVQEEAPAAPDAAPEDEAAPEEAAPDDAPPDDAPPDEDG